MTEEKGTEEKQIILMELYKLLWDRLGREENFFSTRLQIFVLFNSVFLATLGALTASKTAQYLSISNWLIGAVPLLGLSISLLWFLTNLRQLHAFPMVWEHLRLVEKKLREENLLDEKTSIVLKREGFLYRGKTLRGKRLPFWGKVEVVTTSSWIIYPLFICLWGYLAWQAGNRVSLIIVAICVGVILLVSELRWRKKTKANKDENYSL